MQKKKTPTKIPSEEFGTMFVKSPIINFIPWKDRVAEK